MSSKNLTPEQQARQKIDKQLKESGWDIQGKDNINFNESKGVAIREYQTDSGPADYISFVDKTPTAVIEAKRAEEGHRLLQVEEQSNRYSSSDLQYIGEASLPFLYESNGEITRFTNLNDPKPRSREVFSFHRPKTLQKLLNQDRTLRERLQDLPELNTDGLRDCQISAIRNLEQSFKKGRPRALVQMATGSGKTFTAITEIYRLLKYADARRILFLVDTTNLGEQAEQEFMKYTPTGENRKFTELYPVQLLRSSYIAPDSKVCISTIQRMYSILKGEELDEWNEQESPNEQHQPNEPVPVAYNEDVPIEFFDFIVIDECHRSIYNLWRQVLDYFDAFQVGLTATPDNRTFGYFKENVVSEYSHERAVADGVNVGYDVFTIDTEITKNGKEIKAMEYVEKREKLTRKKRWEQLDEDVEYSASQLDKDVVNPSQIRNIIKAFRDNLPVIFLDRDEVPKTLIFAKTDSHCGDIIKTVREEFGEGNDFCKKVTYKTEEDPKSVLQQFRNEYYPRIAVTVDMIATGTDVKPIECLLFMRDVKSRNYFEQMKGRGTRTLQKEDLERVTPSAKTDKTHFVIVDAVGVTKSVKTDSRPLEQNKSVDTKDLLHHIMMGSADEDFYDSAANRLARLNKELDDRQKEKFEELAGKPINTVVNKLLDAHNPDKIKELAQKPEDEGGTDGDEEKAQEKLKEKASSIFTGELIEYITEARKTKEQIIDTTNRDKITNVGWDKEQKQISEAVTEDFKNYIRENKDEIIAFKIFYDQPHRMKEVTYQMIKDVVEQIKQDKPNLAPLNVWRAYSKLEEYNGKDPQSELTALVALLRKVCGLDSELRPFDKMVDKNFQDWVFDKQAGPLKFNEEQMEWLRMIKNHIATSMHFSKDDLDYAPFDAQGGIGRMYKLFGDQMDDIIEEMNEELVA
ncbi:type I restriction enzyme, R subunit [Fodinibius roseus]|uniref:Type I restriction enzyme, R subunit n=1 Tax=Fodinibius roseus TaxID=1194090 RepID=A0A1M5HLT7_9BACT|nr:type I restriction-modification enzyme R subunit C-terminal domain-containing protein [Fodinibius roseus]SHG16924.1 type I restriction enzyme, R subunit [Fodinibius roseus]